MKALALVRSLKMEELMTKYQKQTTVNVREKADLIWSIADKLRGLYKPHEYGNAILPLCVIKRFSDTLKPTREAVLAKNKELEEKQIKVKEVFLRRAANALFYNISPMSFEDLLKDPDNVDVNLKKYLQGFSMNVIDIIAKFEFENEIDKMSNGNVLYVVLREFCSQKAYLGADKVSAQDMGYIFEELVRKFSESYNEEAGAHFTARDIIYLMTDLLIGDDAEELKREGITKTVYDMTMGTSQMLACMTERLESIDENAVITCYGQEFNPQTYAIAKADMLIKGGSADNMKLGDTLSDDAFKGYHFDYIISNPPFGIEWKREQKAVEKEHEEGEAGRFGAGLPPVSDGQMLFTLNGVSKLKENGGRMAIIQNGSPLFSGDAGSGQSNIRGYLLENDWLEAIVQLPNDLFYNTGIATYVWLVCKGKKENRQGKVQLIDASKCFEKRRKSLGNKRNELSGECVRLILRAYLGFTDGVYEENGKTVESKVFANEFFKYSKVTVERPLLGDNGGIVMKKGKPVPNPKLRDTEIIPWGTDTDEYMRRNVLPFAPDAWVDESKTKTGYEIPFTRQFYKYVAPRRSEDIFAELKTLETEETEIMKELFGE